MKCSCQVDDEDEKLGITAGSVVTLSVKFQRASKPGGKLEEDKPKEEPKMIDVHAPYFPLQKNELWWLVIGDGSNKLMNLKKVLSLRDNTEIKIPFMVAKKPGIYPYILYLMSDSYVGFDKKEHFKVNVGKELKFDESKEKKDGSDEEEDSEDDEKENKEDKPQNPEEELSSDDDD